LKYVFFGLCCDLADRKVLLGYHQTVRVKNVCSKYSPEEDVSLAKSPTHAHFALLRVDLAVFDALQYQVAVFGRSVVGPQEFAERCQHFIPQVERLVPHPVRITCGKITLS